MRAAGQPAPVPGRRRNLAGLQDPARVWLAAQVLGHAAFATTEKHYIRAQGQQAAIAWHEILDELRASRRQAQGKREDPLVASGRMADLPCD
jgi:hypothetical protein